MKNSTNDHSIEDPKQNEKKEDFKEKQINIVYYSPRLMTKRKCVTLKQVDMCKMTKFPTINKSKINKLFIQKKTRSCLFIIFTNK
jgi:hypothetical protein